MKKMSVIAFLFLSMLLVAPVFAYTVSADFPELFKYSDQKNANLETALLSISNSFKDNSIPITQELLSAIMATLDKEVGSDYLPIEENGDYGMGTGCTYKISGSCRSTSYDGGVDYKGRGYIQITGKSNYQTYCGSDCVGTSTPELDICGCKNQWQCTVTDASICPQVKALQPDYAAKIFALYYATNKLVSLSNSKNYWDVGKIINGGNAYASDFSIKANEYLTLFSNNPDKIQKLLTWLDSGTPASTPVADQEITVTDTKNALFQKSVVQNAILNPSTSPIETWNKTFGNGVLASVQHSENGYVAAGYAYTDRRSGEVVDCSEDTDYYLHCSEDALLIKVDSDGNEIWRKTFGGAESDTANSVQLTNDGGYLLEGNTHSFGVYANDYYGAAWLIKTDSAGNEVWNRTFIGTEHDRFDSVKPTPDGGCVIAVAGRNRLADSRTYDSSASLKDEDAWLIKIDSAGNVVWYKAFDLFSMNNDDFPINSVMLTSDGGYFLAGRTGFGESGQYIDWIMKADSEGNEIWNKTLTETEFTSEVINGIHYLEGVIYHQNGWVQVGSGFRFKDNGATIISLQPIDGGYILAGAKDENANDGIYNDAWISKIDSDGNEIWSKTFGGTGADDAELIQPTQDGGYIIGGISRWHNGNDNFEAWLTKVNSEGNEIWSKTLFTGGKNSCRGDLIQPTQDGGFIFKGTTDYNNGQNAWMMKFDSQGKEIWNKTFSYSSSGYLGDASYSVLPTADGGCIVAGRYSGDAWLTKIDADGNVVPTGENSPTKLKSSGNDAESWFNEGTALYAQGKYGEAITTFDKAIELKPDYADAWINKGYALKMQGKYDEAIVAYDEAILIKPNNTEAWTNKGMALYLKDKYDEAIQAYDEAIRIDPNDAEAWSEKSTALNDLGKYDEAINAYDEIILLKSKDPYTRYANWAWHNKGYDLYIQGKYDEAVKAYDEAIRLDPHYAGTWGLKGLALDAQGKYDEAIKAYDEAIRLDPTDLAAVWNSKGNAFEALGKTTEANAAFAKAKELGYKG